MVGRAEENLYLLAMLKGAGHAETTSLKAVGKNHGSVGHDLRFPDDPGHQAVLRFIRTQSEKR